MKTIFKVRDTKTGLFSSGGYNPHFTEIGKSWDRLCGVKTHFKLHLRGYRGSVVRPAKIPASWEVVEFELVETEKGKPIKATDLLK